MSQLVCTAQFVQISMGTFGPRPKRATVFAQLLAGGTGVWLVTAMPLSGAPEPAQRIRIASDGADDLDVLRAAFALAEVDAPLGDAAPLAERLRRAPAEATLELSDDEVHALASAVAELQVHLHVTRFSPPFAMLPSDRGWSVTTSVVEPGIGSS